MSIGEAASIHASNLKINQTFTAVAVKDGSNATLDFLDISKVDYGLAVFTKKSTYGHAQLAVHKVKFAAVRTSNFVLESPHELSIDDTIRTFTHLPQQLLPVFYAPEE